MKKIFIVSFCLGICWYGAAQTDVATAKYLQATIDGNSSEWGALNFYDEDTQLNFALANDAKNIYFCFVTGSQLAQMKLTRAGMKITLSTKGKPKREAAVVFPLPQTKQLPDSTLNKNNTATQPASNKESFRKGFIAHHTTMQVSGFVNTNGEIATDNSSIQAALNWDSSSNIVYEIAIPKTEFYGAGYTAKDLKNDITLTVELNGLSRSETGDARYAALQDEETKPGNGMQAAPSKTVGFNVDKRPGSITDPGNMSASLTEKISFKQKFILTEGSND